MNPAVTLSIGLAAVFVAALVVAFQKVAPKVDSGRLWAYIGTIFGVSMSSFANLIETLTNEDVPQIWQRVAAAFFGLLPVGLFVALEVLVRNRVKEHLNWWRAGMFATALAFAVPSYLHMHWLLLDWKQGDVISIITPIGWDGMMLLSTLALLLDPNKAKEPANPNPQVEVEGSQPEPPKAETDAGQGAGVGTPKITQTKPTRRQRKADDESKRQRLARPEDHPLHAEWLRRRGTHEAFSGPAFAEAEGSTPAAARSRMNRWEQALAAQSTDTDASQAEDSITEREEINA